MKRSVLREPHDLSVGSSVVCPAANFPARATARCSVTPVPQLKIRGRIIDLLLTPLLAQGEGSEGGWFHPPRVSPTS